MSDKPAVVYGDYGRDSEGKRIRKKFTGADEVEARLKKREYEKERALGLHKYADNMTVRQWTDIWMNAYRSEIRGTNKVSYDTYVNRMNAEIGGQKIRDIRNIHLYRCLLTMKGMSKSSLTKYRMVIQQVFRKARQNKVIPDDPSEDLELPSGTSGTHRALEKWEIELIKANWSIYNSGLWVMIMMLAGLRRGELVALDWECVDMKGRSIIVERAAEIVTNQAVIKDSAKTEAGTRTLPICDTLYEALSTIPKEKRKGPVCHSKGGGRLTQSSFSWGMRTFNQAMERILNDEPPLQQGRRKDCEDKNKTKKQIEKEKSERKQFSIRAHDLRFTFATALYDAGIDVKSAMYYLGHSDIRMTMNLYTQLSKERENIARAQAITFLDNWLTPKKPEK